MPPAITGPGPLIPPPLPSTPLMVGKGRSVLNSQMTRPSRVSYARMPPSIEPENTTPGMTVGAAGGPGGPPPGPAGPPRPGPPVSGAGPGPEGFAPRAPKPRQGVSGGFVNQRRSPVERRIAANPPASVVGPKRLSLFV